MRHSTLLAVVLAAVLAALLAPRSPLNGAAQEATPATPAGTPAPFIGETFVGQTADPNTFVAVVVAKLDSTSNDQQARAYLCNGTTIDAWLTGTVMGDRLDLGSNEGARLEGTLGDAGVDGVATLADGSTLTFTARPAVGIAGLYTVAVEAEGQLRGSSATGGELAGRVEAGMSVPPGTPVSGFQLVMTVTTPAGEMAEIEAATLEPTLVDVGSVLRLIVREDGQVRGKGMCGWGGGGCFRL